MSTGLSLDLSMNHYQEEAARTAVYREAGRGTYGALAYTALALSSEAGEVAGKVSKWWRGDEDIAVDEALDDERFQSALASELGDVLWFVAMAARELGLSMADIADRNLHKLQARAEQGSIHGAGDER